MGREKEREMRNGNAKFRCISERARAQREWKCVPRARARVFIETGYSIGWRKRERGRGIARKRSLVEIEWRK